MFGLCIFSRNENSASIEIHMLYLNPYKLSYPAAKLVNNLQHQLVLVVVDAVKQMLQLLDREVTDYFAEAFISSAALTSFFQCPCQRKIIWFYLHSNVKSAGFINVSKCMWKAVVHGRNETRFVGRKTAIS
jgi:hypothetical protein